MHTLFFNIFLSRSVVSVAVTRANPLYHILYKSYLYIISISISIYHVYIYAYLLLEHFFEPVRRVGGCHSRHSLLENRAEEHLRPSKMYITKGKRQGAFTYGAARLLYN